MDPRRFRVKNGPGVVTGSFLVLSLAAIGAGCEAADPGGPAIHMQVEDSAGVERVTVDGSPEALPEWGLGERLTTIRGGGERDAPHFEQVRDAAFLEEGGVVVVDGMARSLHLFDPDGEYRETFGGPGEGPGEFQIVEAVDVLPGDTLVSYDRGQRRVQRFHPGEGLVDVTGLRGSETDAAPLDAWMLGGGRVARLELARGEEGEEAPDGSLARLAHTARLVLLEDDEVLRESEAFAGGYTGLTPESAEVRLPFSSDPFADVGPDGAVHGAGGAFRLMVKGPDLSPRMELRWADYRSGLTEEEVREVRQALGEQPMVDEMLSEDLLPEHRPALGDAFLDDEGRIWAARFEVRPFVTQFHRRWYLFSSDGEPTARLDLPEGVGLVDVDGDRVLTVRLDELDVPRIEERKLLKDRVN